MPRLALILRLNAASCLGFGGLFLLAPAVTADVLGDPPVWALRALGAVLAVNAVHLLLAARRETVPWPEILWFSLGDYAWWLATLAMVAAGLWVTTPAGIASALAVAAIVAALGTTQLFALGQGWYGPGLWRRLGQSWMALRPWVKLWLVALNAVFLAAPALLHWPEATVVLQAYAATGPLLLGMAAAQGGLTRALGLAHLVPWVPLMVWLLPRAGTGSPAEVYCGTLAAVLGLCLTLDLWDLIRWFRGERRAF